MNKLNDLDLKYKLLAGESIEIENVGFLKQLTLREIARVGLSKYQSYLSYLSLESSDIENLKNMSDVRTYDILIVNSTQREDFKDLICKGLSLFFDEEVRFYKDNKIAFFYLGRLDNDINNCRVIHHENYEYIKEILILQNKVQKKVHYEPGNERARNFRSRIDAIKQKYKKVIEKKQVTLYDLTSAVAWKSKIGKGVWDLTVFELYDAIDQLRIDDNYSYQMLSIHTGNIDTKKMTKTQWEKITWIKSKE